MPSPDRRYHNTSPQDLVSQFKLVVESVAKRDAGSVNPAELNELSELQAEITSRLEAFDATGK